MKECESVNALFKVDKVPKSVLKLEYYIDFALLAVKDFQGKKGLIDKDFWLKYSALPI